MWSAPARRRWRATRGSWQRPAFTGQFPLVARRPRGDRGLGAAGPARRASDAIPVGARVFHQKFGYGTRQGGRGRPAGRRVRQGGREAACWTASWSGRERDASATPLETVWVEVPEAALEAYEAALRDRLRDGRVSSCDDATGTWRIEGVQARSARTSRTDRRAGPGRGGQRRRAPSCSASRPQAEGWLARTVRGVPRAARSAGASRCAARIWPNRRRPGRITLTARCRACLRLRRAWLDPRLPDRAWRRWRTASRGASSISAPGRASWRWRRPSCCTGRCWRPISSPGRSASRAENAALNGVAAGSLRSAGRWLARPGGAGGRALRPGVRQYPGPPALPRWRRISPRISRRAAPPSWPGLLGDPAPPGAGRASPAGPGLGAGCAKDLDYAGPSRGR